VERCGMDALVSSCEHDNEPSVSIKGGGIS